MIVSVEVETPPCSNCGKTDYISGWFVPEGQLFRCEACKACFKPTVTLVLTATIEPLPSAEHCAHNYMRQGESCSQCKEKKESELVV